MNYFYSTLLQKIDKIIFPKFLGWSITYSFLCIMPNECQDKYCNFNVKSIIINTIIQEMNKQFCLKQSKQFDDANTLVYR